MHRQQEFIGAELLVRTWAELHARTDFTVSTSEVHYLTTLAVALDDDLASLLLLKKLRLADERHPFELPRGLVVMNSVVRFAFDGEEKVRRIAHPSRSTDEISLRINSRLGAGLVGLQSGQQILWPDRDDRLRPLQVLEVESAIAPIRSARRGFAPRPDDPPPAAA